MFQRWGWLLALLLMLPLAGWVGREEEGRAPTLPPERGSIRQPALPPDRNSRPSGEPPHSCTSWRMRRCSWWISAIQRCQRWLVPVRWREQGRIWR